jgi:dihydrofolate reductase
MTISLLLAMDRNNGIGLGNKMPWRLPADLAYFKALTLGHTIVMGRRTFESVGSKPLPGRRNVVLTRDSSFRAEGCETAHSLEEALQRYAGEEELFIVGGGEIYAKSMPYADKLYITVIDHEFEVDTHFPQVNEAEWRIASEKPGVRDERNPYDFVFRVYERRTER